MATNQGDQGKNVDRGGSALRRFAWVSLVAQISLWGQREAQATVVDPDPFVPPCVTILEAWEWTSEDYWSAVPPELLLIPITYHYSHNNIDGAAPPPPPAELVGASSVQVVDRAAPSVPIAGSIVAAERLPELGKYLLRWVPDEPLVRGARYRATVAAGDLEEVPACDSGPFRFSFDVTTDSMEDWVNGAEMTLRVNGSGGGLGCCERVEEQCEATDACFQCWDLWGQPVVEVTWSGPGLPYLDFSTEVLSGPLREVGTIPGYVALVADGVIVGQVTPTALGEYCLRGTVTGPEGTSRSIDSCGTFTQEDLGEWSGSPREECRTRVPSTDCAVIPPGMTELSSLYVVYGPTEDEARAALEAAPYHPVEGCYTLDDLSGTPTSSPGVAGAPSEDPGVIPDAGPGGGGGSGSAPVEGGGMAGATVALLSDAGADVGGSTSMGGASTPLPNAQPPVAVSDADAATTSPGASGSDGGVSPRIQARRVTSGGGGDSSCALSTTSSRSRASGQWALAVVCFLALRSRRRRR